MQLVLQQLINGISIGSIYALLAVGVSLVYSILNFSNFSHGGYISVGAYLGYFAMVSWGLPTAVALLVAVGGAGIVAILADRGAYLPVRKRGGDPLYYTIASLGVGIIIQNLIILIVGPNFKNYPPDLIPMRSIQVMGLYISVFDLIAMAVAAVGLIALEFFIMKTKTGTAIRCAAFDIQTAELMGINSSVLIMTVFGIAGLLAGVGGVFLGVKYTVYPTLGTLQSKAMTGAILGGFGSVKGAIVGALLLGVLEVFVAAFVSSQMRDPIVFVILIVVLLFKPAGLMNKVVDEKV